MKKIVSFFILFLSVYFVDIHPQKDKVALQEMKERFLERQQDVDKELENLAIQYGDLCIVPRKIAQELLLHDSAKEYIYLLSCHMFSIMNMEETSFDDVIQAAQDFNIDQTNLMEKLLQIYSDISDKYEQQANEIFQRMLHKCRNNECDNEICQRQCAMLHTSLIDLKQTFIMLYIEKAIVTVLLKEINKVLIFL